MSIQERIAAGEFEPRAPFPDRVVQPALLRKAAGDLTADEITSLPQVRADYEAAKAAHVQAAAAHVQAAAAYAQDAGEGLRRFRAALEEEHGVVGHPQADLVFVKAEERGHHAGMSEVASAYADYVELLK